MPEPFNPDPMLRPDFIRNATIWDEGMDLVDKMLETEDADELCSLLEHCVDKTDRAHVVIFHLVMRARGKTPQSLILEGFGL